MSVNKYNSTTGQLEPLSQQRIWVGTEAEYTAAVSAGTIGTDMLIYITDDEQGPTDVVEANNKYAVQSGAVYDALEPLRQTTSGKFVLPNGLKICWGTLGGWNGGSTGEGYRTATYPVTFTSKPYVMLTVAQDRTAMSNFIYCPNYDATASSTTQLCATPVWMSRGTPTSNGFSSDPYQYIAIGY